MKMCKIQANPYLSKACKGTEQSKMYISTLEARSRISSFQSHASRQDREFLSVGLVLRDEIKMFYLSVSCFETRLRFSVFRSRASRRERGFFPSVSCFETRTRIFWLHENMSPIDINCHNLKNKIVFSCFHFCKNFTF